MKFYSLLKSRNYYFIPDEIQEKIFRSKILFAGCGLGSNIAILAARTGFRNFSLFDGDIVETSNLNRQCFEVGQVGENKAKALDDNIKKINKESEVLASEKFITSVNDFTTADNIDFVINTVDFSEIFFEITEFFVSKRSVVFLPLNIGFASMVYIFNQENLEYFLSFKDKIKSDFDMFNFLLSTTKNSEVVKKFNGEQLFKKINEMGFQPQLGIAANLNASNVVIQMLNILSNKKIRIFPEVNELTLNL